MAIANPFQLTQTAQYTQNLVQEVDLETPEASSTPDDGKFHFSSITIIFILMLVMLVLLRLRRRRME